MRILVFRPIDRWILSFLLDRYFTAPVVHMSPNVSVMRFPR